ncbi:MAG: acylphosphatase [Acidimicrobiia bacterium]|nr:acylphosphatase [Acidimicrobiia bacterium]
MSKRSVSIRVSGRVQGVYYRQSCRSVARSLGLVGWVRNLADGSVAIRAQGEADAVERLIEWAWLGPEGATVTGVETEMSDVDDTIADFYIQPGPAGE